MENPLQLLQKKIGVSADGSFGPATLKAAAKFFNLSNERAAHFFGQTAHESGYFTIFVENLNYSSEGLKKTFKIYFPNNLAELYAHQPIKIASRVYANRMGNGDEASQTGWKFRGRGALQTTGMDNYKLLSEHLQKPEILLTPELVATEFAFDSALFYFEKNKLWAIADKGVNDDTILQITKRVNGGTNGLSERVAYTKKFYSWLTA